MKILNNYSKTITQDETQPTAPAMLYGIGLTEEDLQKAQVGIVSTSSEGNTCNMHLNDLAKNGNRIRIYIKNNSLNLKESEQELAQRIAEWKQTKRKVTKEVLYKYAQCVSSAFTGYVKHK
jgi:dihydroxyacid dehydratase/phosphogluconate dehydratase